MTSTPAETAAEQQGDNEAAGPSRRRAAPAAAAAEVKQEGGGGRKRQRRQQEQEQQSGGSRTRPRPGSLHPGVLSVYARLAHRRSATRHFELRTARTAVRSQAEVLAQLQGWEQLAGRDLVLVSPTGGHPSEVAARALCAGLPLEEGWCMVCGNNGQQVGGTMVGEWRQLGCSRAFCSCWCRLVLPSLVGVPCCDRSKRFNPSAAVCLQVLPAQPTELQRAAVLGRAHQRLLQRIMEGHDALLVSQGKHAPWDPASRADQMLFG